MEDIDTKMINFDTINEELDSLGVPVIESCGDGKITDNIVNVINFLLQLHRKTLNNFNAEKVTLACFKKDILVHSRKIKSLNVSLEQKESEINVLRKKLQEADENCFKFQKETKEVKQNFETFKKMRNNEIDLNSHKLTRILCENQHWKDKVAMNSGASTSTNSECTSLITKYRLNEEIYQDTIENLQKNNDNLLEEILNLKEEIILLMLNKQNNT